jgi:hypothetical protein
MQVKQFRSKISPNITLEVEGKNFFVKEVIKFRFDDGSFYIKCFLSQGYVFADDLNENMFVLVKETETPFQQPFPKELNFEGKRFTYLYTAHAIAEEVYGEEIFKKVTAKDFGIFPQMIIVT